MTGATQTLWAELIASTLADAGVRVCVVSPGSRSTPLVAALAQLGDGRVELPTIIDERAAAFYALGVARATGEPAALVCTSGTAAAHYLPALIEASYANVPLVAITADRPPELQHCGASQTIDQVDMYGAFVRGAFDLGAPEGSPLALRAVRRKTIQAIARAKGPVAGPVHINVPLRKPLEPSAPTTDADRALAKVVAELRKEPVVAGAPRLAADEPSLAELAAAIAAEPRGVVVAGALPASFRGREHVLALCRRAGYPLLAEAGSQLRFGARTGITCVDHADLLLGSPLVPMPKLIVQLGAEPVATSWPALAGVPRWVLAESWRDPDSQARVVLGDVADSLARLTATPSAVAERPNGDWLAGWATSEQRARGAIDRALAAHPRSEGAVVRAVVQAAGAATLQLGNSLPIRVVDLVASAPHPRTVLTQRGAAGIDGLIASAAGATRAGKPVVLLLGDVSFAHDLGGLLAAREATAPLAIVVIDNAGGRIFAGLPVARAISGAAYERHWTTAPGIDPAAVATALGARAVTAASPAAVATALTEALASRAVTVIHAPVTPTGAQDVRRTALELLR
ncbi:MAG TPA: 2-succinyl-5-enolpyruvyl-6-hydroxy-3-cyclohexene-1-carboxylic-acid synthase [Kofleriaceae bacterium]|nr:2-succinyl-5-enolpyruvyl-6-hydroxy-3-cyclohexene-1-carboxylic-acid synthase [Kofleriaceae bacterium]